MILKFQAHEGGFEDEGEPTSFCLICGVNGIDVDGVEHYLNFQRDFEDEDSSVDRVHFEFDDQINGRYDCVNCCTLTRNVLEIELTEPIDWQKKYIGISVDISVLDDKTFAIIRGGLPRIFRGMEEILKLDE